MHLFLYMRVRRKGRLTVTRVMAEEIFRRHLHVDLGVDLNDTREFFCPQLNVSECAISEVETRSVVASAMSTTALEYVIFL